MDKEKIIEALNHLFILIDDIRGNGLVEEAKKRRALGYIEGLLLGGNSGFTLVVDPEKLAAFLEKYLRSDLMTNTKSEKWNGILESILKDSSEAVKDAVRSLILDSVLPEALHTQLTELKERLRENAMPPESSQYEDSQRTIKLNTVLEIIRSLK